MTVSFIDSLVADYNFFQKSLFEKAPKTKSDDSQEKVKELIAAFVRRDGNPEAQVHVAKDSLEKDFHISLKNAIPLLNLTLTSQYWDNVERIMRAFEARLCPLVCSENEVEKIYYLGEMLLQGLLKNESGLHLVIAPQSEMKKLEYIIRHDVIKEGVFTAWRFLWEADDKEATFDEFALQMRKHFMSMDRFSAPKDAWTYDLLRILSLFEIEIVFANLSSKPWLQMADILKKLKSLPVAHVSFVEKNYAIDEEVQKLDCCCFEVIVGLVIEHLKKLPTTSKDKEAFLEKLHVLHASLKKAKSVIFCLKEIREAFSAVVLHVKDPSHNALIAAQFILSCRLLAQDPRRFEIQDHAHYPEAKALWRVARFSPMRFYCHKRSGLLPQDLTNYAVVIASPDSFPISISGTVRSIQLFGFEKSQPTEWKKMLSVLERVKRGSKVTPLVASYCETSDPHLHGYLTTRL